jgi:hypothetical protein
MCIVVTSSKYEIFIELGYRFFCYHCPKTTVEYFTRTTNKTNPHMYWTIELAATLEEAPWPATRGELIEFAERNGCPQQVLDNLYELDEEDDTPYESIEEIWPDYIMKEDFFHGEEDEGFDYDDV